MVIDNRKISRLALVVLIALAVCASTELSAPVVAQTAKAAQSAQSDQTAQTAKPSPVNTSQSKPIAPPALPKDYIIGVEDVLSVVFFSAKELSGEALVRPDGKISLPVLNDVPAAGMTPVDLAAAIAKAAAQFVKDPTVTVIVKAIHSRKVYVVGHVGRPGSFPLGNDMTVLQAIGEAGGFLEGAKTGDVVIVRYENGQERRFKFNYNDVVRGKKIQQNIRLLPGDTIVVR